MDSCNQTLAKLNDLNDDYNLQALAEDSSLNKEAKLQILYQYGKQFGFGQSAAWTEAMENTLKILGIDVKGIG